jgi:hypothetical protein
MAHVFTEKKDYISFWSSGQLGKISWNFTLWKKASQFLCQKNNNNKILSEKETMVKQKKEPSTKDFQDMKKLLC